MIEFAYLVASVLFILALRGLSSPETARRGNLYGVAGMVIAIVSTLADPGVVSLSMILLGILIGGSIGTVVGLRIKMTALPQLIAAFHSLVGLAAVLVAAAALYSPVSFGIAGIAGIKAASRIELGLGSAIVTDLGPSGTPRSEGSFYWSGAFGTIFWVDPSEEIIGILMQQLRPYVHLNVRPDMATMTYQAIID